MPRSLGGFQVEDPVAVLRRARVAHVIERGPALRRALTAIAPAATLEDIAAAETFDDCSECIVKLLGQGVCALALTVSLAGVVRQLTQLRPPCSARHLQRSYNIAAGRHALRQLLQDGDQRARARLHSCGGPSAGRLFIAIPSAPVLSFNDTD